MKYKKILLVLEIFIISLFFTCCSFEEKKPYGAEVIDYDKVEGINKEGPIINKEHIENNPPMGDKTTFVEVGPPQMDNSNIKMEPTANLDIEPDFGGIPIVTKENSNNGS